MPKFSDLKNNLGRDRGAQHQTPGVPTGVTSKHRRHSRVFQPWELSIASCNLVCVNRPNVERENLAKQKLRAWYRFSKIEKSNLDTLAQPSFLVRITSVMILGGEGTCGSPSCNWEVIFGVPELGHQEAHRRRGHYFAVNLIQTFWWFHWFHCGFRVLPSLFLVYILGEEELVLLLRC